MPDKRKSKEKLRRIALWVDVRRAKPNKLFSPQETEIVRFLRFNKSVPCAECGRRSRLHWTMLVMFRAHHFGLLVLGQSRKTHLPYAPVCGRHPLSPVWEDEWEKDCSKSLRSIQNVENKLVRRGFKRAAVKDVIAGLVLTAAGEQTTTLYAASLAVLEKGGRP